MLSIITVNFNDSEFKKPMAFAINKLTKNNFKLIIVDNGSNEKNLNLLKKIKQEFNFIQIIYRTQSGLASHAHGEALNLAIKKIKTKYTCVLDGDALPLVKNWDEVMIKSLDYKNKIIGATTPKHKKVKRLGAGEFPMPFFSLFETKVFNDLKIDNKPGNIKKGQDTCWQWYTKFKEFNLDGKVFKTLNTRDGVVTGNLSKCFAVEVYYYNDVIIGSHFGRGSSFGFGKYFSAMDKNNIGLYFQSKIPKFIMKYFYKNKMTKDFKKWEEACVNIINNQFIT